MNNRINEFSKKEECSIKKSVFISAPFFSQNQINKVIQVEKALRSNPTVGEIVSPRTDQNGSGYDPKKQMYEWANEIYRKDLIGVKWADVTLEILDFDEDDTDSGTAFEFGYAKALGKPTTTISFDKRPVNLMIGIGSDYDFKNTDEIAKHNFSLPASYKYSGKMH